MFKMSFENLSPDTINEYRRAAYYYYKNHLTQEEIAKRMNMSRQRVNRILSACIKNGIVKISIEGIESCNLNLESELEKKYGLKEVYVIENENKEELNHNLGIQGVHYLRKNIKSNDIIGVARGHAVSAVVDNMPYITTLDNIIVTQLTGSIKEKNSKLGVDKLVYQLADKLQAREELLYFPLIVGSAKLKHAFMQDAVCKNTYSIMRNSNIAIVGIGVAQKQWKHMVNLYDKEDFSHKQWADSVVGEVCTHFYDRNGNMVEPPFRDRMLTLSLEDYKNIPIRLGIAGGLEKYNAIKGAVLGKYINVLITEKSVAEKLLED